MKNPQKFIINAPSKRNAPENLPDPVFDGSDEGLLLAFISEYNNKSSEFKKVSLITENLKSPIQPIRLFCAKKLTELGRILGLHRIEDELIPFITDLILNFEDDGEVLCEFSSQLFSLLSTLKKENILSLIGIRSLEILSGNDDEIVRKTSIGNLSNLIELLDEKSITEEIFPLMKRLIENDLKTKMSCCYLFPIVYPKLQNTDIKKELLQVYCEISKDESPSVRRAAADNIRNFCKLNDNEVIFLLFKLYIDFIKDNCDIVKICTIESTSNLLKKLKNDQQEELILEFTKSMAEEKSWRVKYSSCECISKICSNLSTASFEKKFVSLLMLFLKDIEAEVRSGVLNYFDTYMEHLSLKTFKTNFLPIFSNNIVNDNNLHVRSVFANALLKCVPYWKQDEQIVNVICPMINKLLKDEIVEVQYAAVENVDKIILLSKENEGEDNNLINKYIMPIINDGMKNKNWRFRYLIAENLYKVIPKLNKEKMENYFLKIILDLFNDHAEEIRKTTWKIIEEITKNKNLDNDGKFVINNIWPLQENKLKNSKNYILRISAMKSMEYLKGYYDKKFIVKEIIPLIIETVKKDKVPNVKFSACEVLGELLKYVGNYGEVKKNVENFIKSFFYDQDQDVVFFSKKAFDELQK